MKNFRSSWLPTNAIPYFGLQLLAFILSSAPPMKAGPIQDCNNNGVDDAIDISSGTSADCSIILHDCCTVHPAPECNDTTINDCVCAADPFCCSAEWDANCVGLVESIPCGSCSGNGVPDECDIANCPPGDNACADCNTNGKPDACDLDPILQLSFDCNSNGIPDECESDCNCNGIDDSEDIAAMGSIDCNVDGVPDECTSCTADVVFILDTTMKLVHETKEGSPIEWYLLCEAIDIALDDLRADNFKIRATIQMINDTVNPHLDSCTDELRKYSFPELPGILDVPGTPGECGTHLLDDATTETQKEENWGPATAIAAEYFPWRPDSIRIVLPASDEGPCFGFSCLLQEDQDAIENAISLALTNETIIAPIVGFCGKGQSCEGQELSEILCVERFADQAAGQTGGSTIKMRSIPNLVLDQDPPDPGNVAFLAGEIRDTLARLIRTHCGDCTANGVPDSCEADCNSNGLSDECELAIGIESGTNADCNGNATLDECEDAAGALFVVSVEGERRPLTFQVPPSTIYRVYYDSQRVALYATGTGQVPIISGADLVSGAPDCGNELQTFLELQRCFTGTGIQSIEPGCEVHNVDEDADIDIADFFIFWRRFTGQLCDTALKTVYVEGLTVSAQLGDTRATLDVQDPVTMQFTTTEVVPITVAQLTLSTMMGGLGAALDIALSPAIPPLVLSCNTAVLFDGEFVPSRGPVNGPFEVQYSPDALCLTSASQLTLRQGLGDLLNLPMLEEIEGTGSLDGIARVNIPAAVVDLNMSLLPPFDELGWKEVDYTNESAFEPTIGATPQDLLLLPVTSETQSEALAGATLGHYVLYVEVEGDEAIELTYDNTSTLEGSVSFTQLGSRADGHWSADEIGMTRPCHATRLEIAVNGGSGDDFDAYVELFGFYDTLFDVPGDWTCPETDPALIEGTGIPGTAATFTSLAGTGRHILSIPLDVALPSEFWVYTSFSTDSAGWIIASNLVPGVGAEVIDNCFGGNSITEGCQVCFPLDPFHHSMWARVYCLEESLPSSCDAPAFLLATLFSYAADGSLLEQVDDIPLLLQDNGSSSVAYSSSLWRPLVFVTEKVAPSDYSKVMPIYAESDGWITGIITGRP